jgi:Na+/H+ antiporter NhaD/arsenite permease-like protein
MTKKQNIEIKSDFKFWRYLINFWSIVFFVVSILDFFARNSYGEILNVLAVIYISALAIYVSNKEFERWYDKHDSKHPGEIFVILWTFLVISLFVLSFFFRDEYQVPSSVISSYIAVLTILAVTRKSKEMYQIKRSEKKKSL